MGRHGARASLRGGSVGWRAASNCEAGSTWHKMLQICLLSASLKIKDITHHRQRWSGVAVGGEAAQRRCVVRLDPVSCGGGFEGGVWELNGNVWGKGSVKFKLLGSRCSFKAVIVTLVFRYGNGCSIYHWSGFSNELSVMWHEPPLLLEFTVFHANTAVSSRACFGIALVR